MNTSKWTLKDIPTSIQGKNVIVTGGNSGLGFETVKALASKGAVVATACRSVTKGEEARKKILQQYPDANIVVFELDLASLSSIRIFVSEYKKKFQTLDILFNNAGIMMPPYQLTQDGFESQIGINHLGHYALTAQLLDLIIKTPNARVVNTSSIAHKSADMDFKNFLYEGGKGYTPFKAYSRSKLCNLLFTYSLQKYFEKNSINAIAVAAHPGVSDTNLFNDVLPKTLFNILKLIASIFMQPASMGALPQLRAGTDLAVKGGQFYGPDGFNEMKGYPVLTKARNIAYNENMASQLWEESYRLTKVGFK
jgi:NAD(P)-dependent dehydrogenase (short-subunit alcohol dehydrogenase family)